MTAWAILTAGAAVALYILIGYPILLRVVQFKPRPVVSKGSGLLANGDRDRCSLQWRGADTGKA